jgi:hypothetical protein
MPHDRNAKNVETVEIGKVTLRDLELVMQLRNDEASRVPFETLMRLLTHRSVLSRDEALALTLEDAMRIVCRVSDKIADEFARVGPFLRGN